MVTDSQTIFIVELALTSFFILREFSYIVVAFRQFDPMTLLDLALAVANILFFGAFIFNNTLRLLIELLQLSLILRQFLFRVVNAVQLAT